MLNKLITLFILTISLSSCVTQEEAIATFSRDYALVNAGDLVVTNYSGDSAILLDSDGNFKKLLYNVENNREQVVGVNWNPLTKEIVLSINGSPDRIVAISPMDGSPRDAVVNSQLNGNTFGVSVAADGSYLAIESHQIEKFTAVGSRVNDGTFPTGTLITSLAQINTKANGGFVLCGYGTDFVRTYDDDATQISSTAATIAGATSPYGCDETPDGNILAAWEGSTDTIILYNSTLSSTLATFNDSTILNSPRGVEVKSNGNILVTDAGYHYLIELDSNLQYVRTIASGLLNYPWQVIEIPEY
jgi:hypothetical protein